jgi:hypothetical protein
MNKKIIFLFFLILILPSSYALESIPSPELVPTQELPHAPYNPYSAPQVNDIIFFIALPLIGILIHLILSLKIWKKCSLFAKISNSIIFIVMLFFAIGSVRYSFLRSKLYEGLIIIYIVYPFFALVLFGWLIRYIIVKYKKN